MSVESNSTNEVFSESLNYENIKKRAISSRSYRTKIAASNGSVFLPGQTININLPGNQPSVYYNTNQMYLKVKLTALDPVCHLDRNGIYNFIKRLTIQCASTTLCDINYYNVLTCAMLDMQSSPQWKAGAGASMLGTRGDSLSGVEIGTSTVATRVFTIPIVLNCLSSTTPHRLIPAASLADIQLRFQLASAAESYTSNGDLGYEISEVELVAQMTQLSPQAQAIIDQSTGGEFNILTINYQHTSATQQAGQSSVVANLGFSMSSLERILICHRKTDVANGTKNKYLNSRISNVLESYSLLINSEQYPAREIIVNGEAEVTAENLISDHSLTDFTRGSCMNEGFIAVGTLGVGTGPLSGNAPNLSKKDSFMLSNTGCTSLTAGSASAAGTAAVTSDIGTFLCSVELESGLSDGRSSHIYSGISTISSTVQYKAAYGVGTQACQLDFFAFFTVLISLNTRGVGTWQLRV